MTQGVKIILIIIILMMLGLGALFFLTEYNVFSNKKISQEEQEFNDSGRAKAIIDETDLWKFYEDESAGFSIKYPHDINFEEDKEAGLYTLSIKSEKVDSLEGTMGYDKETALKNMESLKMGQYGQKVDFQLDQSKVLKTISNVYAQEFMVLGRFEVCSVVFERKLYFFNNDYQIVITLSGPKDSFIPSAPEYFVFNKENCGDEKIWDFEKQGQFYDNLKNNIAPQVVQDWFNIFDKIANTIEIYNKQNTSNLVAMLQGKWVSLDDSNSKIEFNNIKKIDYYQNEKMSEGNFEIEDDKYLIVAGDGDEFKYEIIELSDENLTLIYLPRGNTLKYQKSTE